MCIRDRYTSGRAVSRLTSDVEAAARSDHAAHDLQAAALDEADRPRGALVVVVDRVLSRQAIVQGLDVAEVGSGGGHVLRMFPDARLTAIDVSGVFLETARKNLRGYDVRFLKGELGALSLPAASFDRVICTETLEHTVDPAAVLAEIRRLLRPGGVAVITVPNDRLIRRMKDIVRRTPAGLGLARRVSWGGDEYHLHVWAPAELEALLTPHFEVLERACAPFDRIPIRACFKCSPR